MGKSSYCSFVKHRNTGNTIVCKVWSRLCRKNTEENGPVRTTAEPTVGPLREAFVNITSITLFSKYSLTSMGRFCKNEVCGLVCSFLKGMAEQIHQIEAKREAFSWPPVTP